MAVDLANKIIELTHYLTTHCLPYVWEWTRWILEKTRELCLRLTCERCKMSFLEANSSEMRMASSYATENVLRSVQKAMQLTGNLIHGDDLCGDNLLHAEELHEVLKEASWLMELQRKMENEDDSVAGEEKNDNEEDAPTSMKMRLT